MNKKTLQLLLDNIIESEVDFGEIFYENTLVKTYEVIDSKLDTINSRITHGVGIRLAHNNDIVYGYTNDLKKKSLYELVSRIKNNFSNNRLIKKVNLERLKISRDKSVIKHNDMDDNKKKEYLLNIDKLARSIDSRIVQVDTVFYESDSEVIIANTNNTYVKENRPLTRLNITVIAKDDKRQTKSSKSYGISGGYELLDEIDIKKEVENLAISAIKKLSAKPCPSGEMPVIIGPGFGAVIFHEACGHSMEATTVSYNTSILSGKLNEKIASSKVSIIDDGTLKSKWGTTVYDDEGNKTRKNVLIKNGVLKGYLIDYLNNRKMNMEITGSGRRESYKYAPTSRMNNTYLVKGHDKIEDMIKSVKYGIYAVNMGGGSVDPVTGDFNFAVNEAYLIENGKITDMVLGGSLIGNTLDILNNVSMVSDDLSFDTGFCGSVSGNVPVTIGEPTILVSKILVGGN